jgi:predicted RNA binding protein YcfA (HicA-like mRNA interferase family)
MDERHVMSGVKKRLLKMRCNLKDWQIEDLLAIADALGIEYRSAKGSHVVFRHTCCNHVTVPAKRPIKPVYITQFLELANNVMEENTDESDAEEQI